jgi:hypothetical protein
LLGHRVNQQQLSTTVGDGNGRRGTCDVQWYPAQVAERPPLQTKVAVAGQPAEQAWWGACDAEGPSPAVAATSPP